MPAHGFPRKRLVRDLVLSAAFACAAALAPLAARGQAAPGARGREAPPVISAVEASEHLGSAVTVCDTVVGTRYAVGSRGQPTFLNFVRPYPDQPFTVVIWGRYRDRFPEPPERAYLHRRVCVTGTVTSYRGTPQMEVRDPAEIRIVHPAPGPGTDSEPTTESGAGHEARTPGPEPAAAKP